MGGREETLTLLRLPSVRLSRQHLHGPKAVASATAEPASSSTRGSGWATSSQPSPLGAHRSGEWGGGSESGQQP